MHAAAVGAHSELSQVATTFTVLAVAQLAWGVAALVAPSSMPLLWAGLALNLGALGGWIAAKTVGISFIDGFETAEAVQRADGLAALLAGISVLAAVATLARPARAVGARFGVTPLLAACLVGLITVPAMAATGDHAHTTHGTDEHADGDDHADGEHAGDEHEEAGDEGDDGHEDDATAVVAPVPYDPTMPIDLGGVDGVTPQQQARAENLIAITLDRLPKYHDPATAEADGFHSIGDGFTGHEHYINWDHLQDGRILNPDYPESLVYEFRDGKKTLVSAMYMLERGQSWEQVPDIGGPLTQWHVHDDLCFTDDPVAPRVSGITSVGGSCQPPLRKLEPLPMIHVWIVPHECGPFAALSGVGAGQIQEGEERLCDTAHGGH